MKHLKKLASVLLALVMVLALAAPAFAADYADATYTISNEAAAAGYQLVILPIFKGTPKTEEVQKKNDKGEPMFEEDGTTPVMETVVTDQFETDSIVWSDEITAATAELSFITAMRDAGISIDSLMNPSGGYFTDAERVARILHELKETDERLIKLAEFIYTRNVLKLGAEADYTLWANQKTLTFPTGYYLIVNKCEGKDPVYVLDRHMGNDTARVKLKSETDVKKEVLNDEGEWAKFADKSTVKDATAAADGTYTADQGLVDFRISAPIPGDYASFVYEEGKDDYSITFTDKQDSGLGAPRGLKVYIVKGANKATDPTPIPGDYDANGDLIETNANWIELSRDPISTADYSFLIGEAAGAGNTFMIQLSNMKSSSSRLHATDFNDLTSEDKIVIVYQAELLELSDTNTSLKNNNTVELDWSTNKGDKPTSTVTVYTFKLDFDKIDGDTMTETTKNKLAGAEFQLQKLTANAITTPIEGGDPITEAEAFETVWTYTVDANGTTGTDGTKTGLDTFTVNGLDVGQYKLVETKAPGDYNKAGDTYFVIEPTYNDAGVLTGLKLVHTNENWDPLPEGSKDGDVLHQSVKTEVINYSGLVLPETGGIGTTIFYIVGGVLVLGAVVLLITRRRASADDE